MDWQFVSTKIWEIDTALALIPFEPSRYHWFVLTLIWDTLGFMIITFSNSYYCGDCLIVGHLLHTHTYTHTHTHIHTCTHTHTHTWCTLEWCTIGLSICYNMNIVDELAALYV